MRSGTRHFYASAAMAAVFALASCSSAPLREPPPLIVGAPDIPAGFYTVHRVVDGVVAEEPGAAPLGSVAYLSNQEYLEHDRYLGLRGVFAGDGVIRSRQYHDRVAHELRYTDTNGSLRKKKVVIEAFDAEAPATLELRLGEKSRAASVALRFMARRPDPARSRVVLIAHRGSYYYSRPAWNQQALYPANTIPAFAAALSTGFQGFEADVRVTSDKKWVVSHDQDVSVATDGSGFVHDRTLDELTSYAVLSSPLIPESSATTVSAYIAAPMVGLRETLERFLPDERVEAIVVDIKPDTVENLRAAATDTLEPFAGTELLRKLVFVAHDEAALMMLRQLSPDSRFALEGDLGTEPIRDPAGWMPEMRGEPRGVSDTLSANLGMFVSILAPSWRIAMAADFMAAAREHDYAVMAWTVNSAIKLGALIAGVHQPDLLLTDAPYYRIAALQLPLMDATDR